MRARLCKTVRLEAAHMIPNHPGKCRFLHGHSYIVDVFVEGDVDPETGFVLDFDDMRVHTDAVIRTCDHRYLNDLFPEMLTTAENLASMWLQQLRLYDSRYTMVRVHETADNYAEVSM